MFQTHFPPIKRVFSWQLVTSFKYKISSFCLGVSGFCFHACIREMPYLITVHVFISFPVITENFTACPRVLRHFLLLMTALLSSHKQRAFRRLRRTVFIVFKETIYMDQIWMSIVSSHILVIATKLFKPKHNLSWFCKINYYTSYFNYGHNYLTINANHFKRTATFSGKLNHLLVYFKGR